MDGRIFGGVLVLALLPGCGRKEPPAVEHLATVWAVVLTAADESRMKAVGTVLDQIRKSSVATRRASDRA